MPMDHHLLSILPTYGPCNMVVNLQPFVTERVICTPDNILIVAATNSSRILADVFCESAFLAYTSCGYNCLYGPRHLKIYNVAESLCASFVRDVQRRIKGSKSGGGGGGGGRPS